MVCGHMLMTVYIYSVWMSKRYCNEDYRYEVGGYVDCY